MKTFGLLALAASAKLVSAHATVMAAWVNDKDQGLGNSDDGYIRTPPSNSPITDVTSKDLTCNVGGDSAASKYIKAAGGDKLTFEWHHNSRDAGDDIIDLSHKGPVLVYMAPTEAGSGGSGWVKIAEDGYADGTWAVETLVENKGKHSVTIPDVPAGKYLFRPEIIALHEGSREGGAQFYMECVQVEVTSSGSKTLPEGVSIPGAYKANDEGVQFDIYGQFDSYPIPGPALWDGASGSGSGSSSPKEASATSSAAPTSSATAPAATTTVPTIPTAAPTFTTSVRPTSSVPPSSTTAPAQPSSSSGAGGPGQLYGQCGGLNFKKAAGCAAGLTCKEFNPYYHQCVKA